CFAGMPGRSVPARSCPPRAILSDSPKAIRAGQGTEGFASTTPAAVVSDSSITRGARYRLPGLKGPKHRTQDDDDRQGDERPDDVGHHHVEVALAVGRAADR